MTSQIMTNTRFKTFKRCQRLHFYLYEEGIDSADKPLALSFGSGTHTALEYYWLNHRVMPDIEDLCTSEIGVDDSIKMHAMIHGYDLFWGHDEWETVACELEFSLPLKNPDSTGKSRTYVLGGKIDAIATHKETGLMWLIEHKTASGDVSEGSQYWQRLALDEQISIYLYAAREMGFPVVGCQYDVLRKPSDKIKATPISKRKYKKDGSLYKNQRSEDESEDEYRARLFEEIGSNPNKYYVRGEVIRLDEEIEEFMTDLWFQSQMISEYRRRGLHPKNSQACFDYFRACKFFDLCCKTSNIEDPRWVRKEKIHNELGDNTNETERPKTLCVI